MSSASPAWAWPRALGPGATAEVGALLWQDKDQDQAHVGVEGGHSNKSKSPILLPKPPLHTPRAPERPTAALRAETNQSLSLLLSS